MKLRFHSIGLVLVVAIAACADSADVPPAGPTTTDAAVPTVSIPTTHAPAASSTEAGSTTTTLAPITGYGSFAGQSWFEIDKYLLIERIIACTRDQGFNVEQDPGQAGILFDKVPIEQNPLASATVAACTAGLDVADPDPLTREQIELVYAWVVESSECLRGLGYDIPEEPSVEEYIDAWNVDPWSPWTWVNLYGMPVDQRLEVIEACPLEPPGGFGAWKANQ